jgi:uncharacterized protein (TIGR03437 family)
MACRAARVVLALLSAATLYLSAPQAHAARNPASDCGTEPGRLQQEIFLHQRHVLSRALAKPEASRSATPIINQDVGNVAVIDDSGGVVGRRNLFDLDRKTLVFSPQSAGYNLTLGGDTFDLTASAAGTRLPLADDDTRQIALPFAFTFFGKSYQQLWVNSNGTITFGQGDTDYTGSYGHFLAGPPVIALAFTDLDPSAATAPADGVRVFTASDRVVISWMNVPLAGSAGYAIPPLDSLQIRIYPDSHFEITYRITNVPQATVGITPGNFQPATLVDFTTGPAGVLGPVAEIFASVDAIDMVYTAQKFYQAHDDSYDYLVVYNASGLSAGSGIVAYEMTTRSITKGIGDTATDLGASFGSQRRLQAVLNMGPLTQYPTNPNGTVLARYPTGDTPLTLLGHEAGHLFLALVSVPDPTNPGNQPMLGRALVHWAFTYDSEASFLEGNRIRDDGPNVSPRFTTTGTVEGYSPLDQYLMGFRTPDEVPQTFAVLNASEAQTRAPQTGIGFSGSRLDVNIADVIQVAGRRIPDSTVAQRKFRFAFLLIVPAGSNLSDGGTIQSAIAEVDRYRSEFEPFYATATGNRAIADTSIRQAATLSLAPFAGVVAGANGSASITLAAPATAPLTFSLHSANGVMTAPATTTMAAGATSVTFPTFGAQIGVEEFSATSSDTRYDSPIARVQVGPLSGLHAALVSGDRQIAGSGVLPQPIVVQAVDQNNLAYSNVRLDAMSPNGGTVVPATAITDEFGRASFQWTPPTSSGKLNVSVDQVPGSSVTAIAAGTPAISSVVNAASFQPKVAAGAFITILGTNLTGGLGPFPPTNNRLGATIVDPNSIPSISVNGAPVSFLYASDTQVNLLAPANLSPGSADVSIATYAGISPSVKVEFDPYAPGIFFDSASDYGAILIAGTSDVTQVHPAAPGAYLEIYCTGLGSLNAQGQTVTPQVTVAGISAPVLYSGVSSIAGLYQVNVQVPPGVLTGKQPLSLSIAGIASNTVSIQIGQ